MSRKNGLLFEPNPSGRKVMKLVSPLDGIIIYQARRDILSNKHNERQK